MQLQCSSEIWRHPFQQFQCEIVIANNGGFLFHFMKLILKRKHSYFQYVIISFVNTRSDEKKKFFFSSDERIFLRDFQDFRTPQEITKISINFGKLFSFFFFES